MTQTKVKPFVVIKMYTRRIHLPFSFFGVLALQFGRYLTNELEMAEKFKHNSVLDTNLKRQLTLSHVANTEALLPI